ncbi:hypothetical protein MHN79_11520 [Vibrio sp. Of14-4]|uniref:hypothetical protein n=1 Tax=Vibrio sp. Of14-4 TaxID=2724878 RepID=UPI001EF2DDCC|nr:hypothetical protein [Vibrio sp. Of14-4]MCG7490121.1 hypothetical protein [Vibrio sp. Of14-4]
MLIPMSDRDINRFKVLQDVRERRLRQVDAAGGILNISPRQVEHPWGFVAKELNMPEWSVKQCKEYAMKIRR